MEMSNQHVILFLMMISLGRCCVNETNDKYDDSILTDDLYNLDELTDMLNDHDLTNDLTNGIYNEDLPSDCKQVWSIKDMTLSIFSGFVCIASLVGNTVTVVVITFSRQLRSRGSYLLLASLAVADIGEFL